MKNFYLKCVCYGLLTAILSGIFFYLFCSFVDWRFSSVSDWTEPGRFFFLLGVCTVWVISSLIYTDILDQKRNYR